MCVCVCVCVCVSSSFRRLNIIILSTVYFVRFKMFVFVTVIYSSVEQNGQWLHTSVTFYKDMRCVHLFAMAHRQNTVVREKNIRSLLKFRLILVVFTLLNPNVITKLPCRSPMLRRRDWFFSQSYHASWYYQSFFIYQQMHKRNALKRILKFTLRRPQHVSVQSPSSGSVLFELAKVTVVKIIN